MSITQRNTHFRVLPDVNDTGFDSFMDTVNRFFPVALRGNAMKNLKSYVNSPRYSDGKIIQFRKGSTTLNLQHWSG